MRPFLTTTCAGYPVGTAHWVFDYSGGEGGEGEELKMHKNDLTSSEMAGNKSNINKRSNNFNS